MAKTLKLPQFVDDFFKYIGYTKDPTVALSTGATFGNPALPPYKQHTNLEAYQGWVYACVRARAQDTSQIKLRLLRKRKNGNIDEVIDHPILSLIQNVNNFMTMRDLFEQTQIYQDLAGESFWYLVRAGKRPNSPIIEIWLLRPDWVHIKTDETKYLTGYIYRVPGAGDLQIEARDIIHIKQFNPLDVYRGLSIIRAAANTIDADTFAESYNRKFFMNSAIPSVVLKTDQKLDSTIIARMRTQWQNEYGGVESAHKMAILEGGLEATPFSMSQKDMEFLEGQNFSRDKIFAIFQVPKSRLGMTEKVSVSNAEATINIYIKNTIYPLMEKMRDALNEYLIPQFGDDTLCFTIDDPTPENKEVKLKVYETLFNLGALSGNEIRQQEGLSTIEGLDNYFLPINLTTVDNLESGANQDVAQQPIKGPNALILPKFIDRNPRPMKRVTDEISKSITNGVVKLLSQHAKLGKKEVNIGTSDLSADAKQKVWTDYVEKSINYENKYKEAVKKFFATQCDGVIARAQATVKAIGTGDINKILFKLSTENKIGIDILIPILREYFEASGQDALDLVGSSISFNLLTSTVRQFFTGRALLGVQNTNEVSRKALRNLLVDAVKNGDGIDVVTRNIKKLYDDFDTVRAERIARTEIMRAGNDATLEGYMQSGVVSGKQWYTALDELVCQWCEPLNGKVELLDQNYFEKTQEYVGSKGGTINFDFEAIPAPPLHPSCRCVLLPVVSGVNPFIPQSNGLVGGINKETTIEYDKEAITESIRRELMPEIKAKIEKEIDDELGKLISSL